MSTEKNTSFAYFEGWHRLEREAVGPISKKIARQRHETRKPYTVVVQSGDAVFGFVEVADDFYGVSFVDELRREYLMYTFEEGEPGRLFLKEALFREFEGDSASVSRASIYRFSTSGRVQVERVDASSGKRQFTEKFVTVTGNWESTPHFGEYLPLLKKERCAPL